MFHSHLEVFCMFHGQFHVCFVCVSLPSTSFAGFIVTSMGIRMFFSHPYFACFTGSHPCVFCMFHSHP